VRRDVTSYRIHDACTGLIEKGDLDVAEMRRCQPWSLD